MGKEKLKKTGDFRGGYEALMRKLEKPKLTEKEAREVYAYIAVGQLKVDGFLKWLGQLGVFARSRLRDEKIHTEN